MTIYRQHIFENELKYINGEFVQKFFGESGECNQYHDHLIIHSISNDLEVDFIENNSFLINKRNNSLKLSNALQAITKSKQISVVFTTYLKEHFEKVLINNEKEDYRIYRFLRIVARNNFGNILVEEVPVSLDIERLLSTVRDITLEMFNKFKEIGNSRKPVVYNGIPLVLSQKAAGYFIHETIGHMLEADIFLDPNCNFNKNKDIKISKKLNVVDDPANLQELIGINKIDDEGVQIRPIQLIENGEIKNIIRTKDYQSKEGFKTLFGLSRKSSYKFKPIPRMRATFILSNEEINQEQIISKYNNGVFLDSISFGNISPVTCDYFLKGNGYLIENGELTRFIDSVIVRGNILKDLDRFGFIGNDLKFTPSECYKKEQVLRVCVGAPTVSLEDMMIHGDVYDNNY